MSIIHLIILKTNNGQLFKNNLIFLFQNYMMGLFGLWLRIFIAGQRSEAKLSLSKTKRFWHFNVISVVMVRTDSHKYYINCVIRLVQTKTNLIASHIVPRTKSFKRTRSTISTNDVRSRLIKSAQNFPICPLCPLLILLIHGKLVVHESCR